ncbi:Rpn family recombination-promoting nuclease/putative transposase [Stieleria sp. TO1_6]|uniref:Rpn family recombination-promoting nuclease/putative transposase n=1 Tax=Stieleria tagensis TaxID=2956795 RepID=UPI00209AB495|nr:Rpn family recombination-promoting nuclease/putative transposase [Stieleria tagensis]MCO8120161.1 Rpn family recombination-promoting nuclease/putative transposase [Stieleria tagensis]
MSSTPDELRRLLPDPVFTEAIGVLEMIARNPEEKRYYESRLKMQRDEQARLEAAEARGEERGEARGEERGKAIGRVQLLQSLVGNHESTVDQLRTRTLDDLAAMEQDLKRQLRDRG